MRNREKYTGDKSPFFEFPKKQGRGLWYRVSRPVSAAMGWRDELVLRTNHDFYNAVRDHLKSDFSYWLSYAQFEKITGLSKHYQDQAYENLYQLGLIKGSDEKGADNAKCRRLNLHATWILFWIIYHHNKMLIKKYKKQDEELRYPDKCKKLRAFYKKLLKKKLAKRFRNFVREITRLIDDIEELESGEWDEKILDFYDTLCKRNK